MKLVLLFFFFQECNNNHVNEEAGSPFDPPPPPVTASQQLFSRFHRKSSQFHGIFFIADYTFSSTTLNGSHDLSRTTLPTYYLHLALYCNASAILLCLETLVHIRRTWSRSLGSYMYRPRMKFEDFLMEKSEGEMKKLELQEEVDKLRTRLEGEEELNRVLHCALDGPVSTQPHVSSLLPPQVQVLLAELAAVEEEIFWLEKRVDELKMRLYQERKDTAEWKRKQLQKQQQQQRQRQQKPPMPRSEYAVPGDDLKHRTRSHNYDAFSKGKAKSSRRVSVDFASDILSMSSSESTGETNEGSRRHTCRVRNDYQFNKAIRDENPNVISEELVKCLIGIFLDLNQAAKGREDSPAVPKLSLSCMKPKGFASKPSINCKTSSSLSLTHQASNVDPYGVLLNFDGSRRDIGPYKDFIQVTSTSLDLSGFSGCLPAIGKLRVLMHKLSDVDVTSLTYKQKLAFWINIYNGCIMHAFLEHGLPSEQDKLLTLMNKGVLNVGGTVLNALAIEHFILRYPYESNYGSMGEKEMLLPHAYGLGYPEPNVTFALCRGNWSSPALRVYTSNEVVNELGRARKEYLEASVGIKNKKKILVPKLLQWHMQDFADSMESLLEWIYSQLPPCSSSLRKSIMENLNRVTKSPMANMVEVQPYKFEFRYLLPL